MIFKRRVPERWHERFRVWLLPRRSYTRSFRYYWKRMLRIKATPHAIAAGVAAGTFASFTPFMGLHFILAFVLAWLVAGNMIAAALGTAVGNPLTFPAIWAATHGTGTMILGMNGPQISGPPMRVGAMWERGELMAVWDPILKPMLVGGVPLGLVAAAIMYGLTRFAVSAFQHRRNTRFAEINTASGKPELGA